MGVITSHVEHNNHIAGITSIFLEKRWYECMMFFSGVKELRENGVSQRAFWCVKMSLSCWYKVTTSSPVSKERKDWVGKTNKGQLQGCLAAPGHQNVNSRIVYFPWNGICNISTYGWKWKSSNCLFLLGQDVHKLKNHSPIFYAYLTYKLGIFNI